MPEADDPHRGAVQTRAAAHHARLDQTWSIHTRAALRSGALTRARAGFLAGAAARCCACSARQPTSGQAKSKTASLPGGATRSIRLRESCATSWRSSKRKKPRSKQRGTVAHVMHERAEPAMAYRASRGEYDKRRDPVKADTPDVLPPMPPELPKNRLGLAQLAGRDPRTR